MNTKLVRFQNERILRAMLPPLTGNDRPGEWPKDKFISLFGSEKLESMVASGILAAGEARTDDIPAFIWEEYPDNAAWCIQQSEHGNIPYSSRVEYVSITPKGWNVVADQKIIGSKKMRHNVCGK